MILPPRRSTTPEGEDPQGCGPDNARCRAGVTGRVRQLAPDNLREAFEIELIPRFFPAVGP